MEKNRIRLFEDVYRKSIEKTAKRDNIELLTDFINKLKEIIHQGQFIVDMLENQENNIDQ